jgi:hypothetical protein
MKRAFPDQIILLQLQDSEAGFVDPAGQLVSRYGQMLMLPEKLFQLRNLPAFKKH